MDNLKRKYCGVCGNSENNSGFRVKEMHIGTYETFDYFECSICKCIQIGEIPANIEKYYPSEYYSFSELKQPSIGIGGFFIKQFKKNLVKHYTGSFNLIGLLSSLFYSNPFPWLKKEIIDFNAKILDIGCGSGRLLLSMQRAGFNNLVGIDPFIKDDIYYSNGVNIYKKDIFQTDGFYDFIMLHHSFEHMENPLKVIEKLKMLIKENGTILIRIPVTGGYAWRKYREFWAQLDAPRHFFIHSVQSIQYLCIATDLKIDEIVYDSTVFQFTGSERYQRGISLSSKISMFTKKEIKLFQKETDRLNKISDGDMACFYLKKNSPII